MQSQGMCSSLCDCCKLCWLGSVTCVVAATTQPLETAYLPRGPAYPLRPGSLYIGLWARTDTFGPDAFHWGLYHHFWNSQGQTRQTQGRKYHIRNYNNYWIQDFGTTSSAMNSLLWFVLSGSQTFLQIRMQTCLHFYLAFPSIHRASLVESGSSTPLKLSLCTDLWGRQIFKPWSRKRGLLARRSSMLQWTISNLVPLSTRGSATFCRDPIR